MQFCCVLPTVSASSGTPSVSAMSIVREIPTLNPSLEHLLKSYHRKSYNAKKIIIHEGDDSSSLYYSRPATQINKNKTPTLWQYLKII